VVHPSNPNGVTDLSIKEVRDIFAAGSGFTWTVVSREEGSGTRETFEKKVMGDEEISASAEFLPSNGAVKQKVAATSNAIGYLSLGYVDSSVKAVNIDGVECNTSTVRSGAYAVSRTLYYVTKGEAEGDVLDYINFCLSTQGQQIVEEEGYIPLQ
jgi:phosphate transport system substrate-binding protein